MKQFGRATQVRGGAPATVVDAFQIGLVSFQIGRAAGPGVTHRLLRLVALELGGDGERNLVLDGEDVVDLALEGFGPDVVAVFGIDKLRGDANPVAGLTHAALKHGVYVERPADLRDVLVLAFELKGRGSGRDLETLGLGQHIQNLLGDAIGEILLIALGAEVGKREDRDGELLAAGLALRQPAAAVLPVAEHGNPDDGQHQDGKRQAPKITAPARRATLSGFPSDGVGRHLGASLIGPGDDHAKRQPYDQKHRHQGHRPVGKPQRRHHVGRQLHNRRGHDDVDGRDTDNLAPLQFLPKLIEHGPDSQFQPLSTTETPAFPSN